MKLLTRESVLRSNHLKMEQVDVTEWGEINHETGQPEPTFVFVREMTAAERERFERQIMTVKGRKSEVNPDKLRQKIAIAVCCDEHRQPIFAEGDIELFNEKSIVPLDRIMNVHNRMSGYIADESFEEKLKN